MRARLSSSLSSSSSIFLRLWRRDATEEQHPDSRISGGVASRTSLTNASMPWSMAARRATWSVR
eukprot:12881396-Prorocentrum_lima.AAC.1